MTQQINLIDVALQSGRDWLGGLAVAGTCAAVALLVAAHYAYEFQAWHKLLQAPSPTDEAAADPGAAASDPLSDQLALAEAELAGGERLEQALSQLVDTPRDTAARLGSLVNAMPSSMWLREVEFVGSRGLRISCAALRSEDVARYMAQISATPAFAGLPVRVLEFDHQSPTADDAASRAAAEEGGASQRAQAGADGVPASLAYYRFELSSLEPAAEGNAP